MNAPFQHNQPLADKPPLKLLVAAPRGFCAGVERAIAIVELSLERYGAPVYVRHEIVHNRHVVDGLKAQGAVFVEELDEVPDGAPVIFYDNVYSSFMVVPEPGGMLLCLVAALHALARRSRHRHS